jgi:uncharacterized protein (TIGR04206 family)
VTVGAKGPDQGGRGALRAARRRWLALAGCGALPWTAIVIGSELTLLFPYGVFNSNPPC